jgi:hypothetical protein
LTSAGGAAGAGAVTALTAGAAFGAAGTLTGAAAITTPVAKERAMLNSSSARLYSGRAVIVKISKTELNDEMRERVRTIGIRVFEMLVDALEWSNKP